MVLKYFSMDSGLRRRCSSGLPRIMLRSSILQDRDGFKCIQMSAIRSSSRDMAFLVGSRLPFALTPMLMLSVASCTMKWGHLSVSFDILMRSTVALCLCTIVGKSREYCKCSASLKRDCANVSQLCGLALVSKTEPIGM